MTKLLLKSHKSFIENLIIFLQTKTEILENVKH